MKFIKILAAAVTLTSLILLPSCKKDVFTGIDENKAAPEALTYDYIQESADAISLYWDATNAVKAGATSFTVQLTESPTAGADVYESKTSKTLKVGDSQYEAVIFSGLVEYDRYYVRIRANYPRSIYSPWEYLKDEGDLAMVSVGHGLVVMAWPVSPSDFAAVSKTYSTADVSWGVVGQATSYEMGYKESGAAEWIDIVTDKCTVALSDLKEKTTYDLRVRACRALDGGTPEYSQYVTTTVTTVEKPDFKPEIETAEQFAEFFASIAGQASASDSYKLIKDIDMKGETVSSAATFAGTFDGNGKTVKNLKFTAPLFTENKGTVKGLIIGEDCTVDVASVGQEFAPVAKDNYGTIENCTNKAALTFKFNAPVTGSTVYAGICVYNNAGGAVKGCKNEGEIKYDVTGTSEAWGVAGICAFSEGAVDGCSNSAAISCAAERCSAKTKIRNISGTGCLGGVVCYAATGMVVSNCTNSGNLDYNVYRIEDASGNINRNQVGGIVAAPAGEVKACTNTGSITAKAVTSTGTALSSPEYIVGIGGISGGDYFAAGTNESDITDCVNEGAINVTFDALKSNSTVGGIVAWPGVEGDEQTNKITNCTNKGNITISGGGKGRFGGVAGGSGNLFKCKNYGTVTNNTNVSGSCVGGVSGYRNNTLKIEECESYGDVVNTHGDLVYTGGLIGAWGGKDFNSGIGCIVKCNLDVTADDLGKANNYTGLIIGRYNGDMKDILGSAEKPIKVQTGSSVTINGTKTVADGSNFTTLCTGKERTVSFNGADPGCKRQVYVSFE